MKQDTSAAQAEAAAWVARLHSSGRTPALEEGLRRWIKADAAHAEAFEIATEAWEIGGAIPSGALPRMSPSARKQSQRPQRAKLFAFAAAMSLIICVTAYLLIQSSGTVHTQIGEQRILTLEDGSRIVLNTDTRLQVRYESSRRLVQLQAGEAMFDVAQNPKWPFVVMAGQTKVVALGTSFVVRKEPEQLSVTLVEGKVSVQEVAERILAPGERLTFEPDHAPTLDRPVMEKVTAWRRGEVILDKTPLREALAEMNRYSEIKLVVDDPKVADIRVSGIFRAGDSVRFAQAVSVAYRLTMTQERRQIRLAPAAI